MFLFYKVNKKRFFCDSFIYLLQIILLILVVYLMYIFYPNNKEKSSFTHFIKKNLLKVIKSFDDDKFINDTKQKKDVKIMIIHNYLMFKHIIYNISLVIANNLKSIFVLTISLLKIINLSLLNVFKNIDFFFGKLLIMVVKKIIILSQYTYYKFYLLFIVIKEKRINNYML